MDALQQIGKQRFRDGHLGTLEGGSPGVAHHLRSNLYEFQLDASERPVRHLSRKREPPHEVAQVVCQHEQGEANPIGYESRAGEPRPGQGQFPFLDALLASATLVVEPGHVGGLSLRVGDDEANPREELALVPLRLGDYPSGLRP